jgi:hypothetical protein
MKVTESSIVARNQEHLSTPVGEDQVILDTKSNKYFGLENVASRIWALTENSIAVEGIIAKLIEEFEVDRETLSKDCISFISDLEKRGLVRIKE